MIALYQQFNAVTLIQFNVLVNA